MTYKTFIEEDWKIIGTQEYLLAKAKKEGIEKGCLEKRAIALEFKKMDLPVADITSCYSFCR